MVVVVVVAVVVVVVVVVVMVVDGHQVFRAIKLALLLLALAMDLVVVVISLAGVLMSVCDVSFLAGGVCPATKEVLAVDIFSAIQRL